MASSDHFDSSKTYDVYKAVDLLDPACTDCLMKGNKCFQHFNKRSLKCHFCFVGKKPCHFPGVPVPEVRRYFWSTMDGKFGREFPVSEAPTPDETSGYSSLTGCRRQKLERWTNTGGPIPVGGRPIYSSSEIPLSRIYEQGVVKWIRRIANSPTDPDSERSVELDGEEVQIVNPPVGHPPALHLLNLLPIISPIKTCTVLQEISNKYYPLFHILVLLPHLGIAPPDLH
ncbi:hypothetical protein O181_002572 [Austropuccinia psidii MF-1]|uniref:Uncharacterized protein n=1 Tax=Austropuccinia psidii MF-1 TaxID=1389203 RepID=A0A9Q3BD16_9BASI|nr:hypothetical protein [Austropuccinia psidii MF-1]